jgi:hypothetical protein
MNIITYKKMMQEIYSKDENGQFVTFHCEFMKYNLNKKEAGEIVDVKAVIVAGNSSDKIVLPQGNDEQIQSITKNANHKRNKTINIRLLIAGNESNQIIKLHPILILKFNNKEVVL